MILPRASFGPVLLVVLLGVTRCVTAQCGAVFTDEFGNVVFHGNTPGGVISLSSNDPRVISLAPPAASEWANGCGSSHMPQFVVNGAGNLPTIDVELHDGVTTRPSGSCSNATISTTNGIVTGGIIDVWQYQANGYNCFDVLQDVLKHELGHAMGLRDTNCPGDIMSGVFGSIGAADCQAIDEAWSGSTPPGHGCPQVCLIDPDSCTTDQNNTCRSPIVVNLDGRGFEFSGPDDPVRFDLNADGYPELITWTGRGSGDAFLVLDLDGDGRVDDGRELFGNYTLLPDGRMAGNGYLALAQYDALGQGGNGDGVIDSRDAVFSHLKLWIDANHDGIAQPSELMSLEEAGLVRIDLNYRRSERRDRYGNRLRFVSNAWIREGVRERRVSTVDVFFVQLP